VLLNTNLTHVSNAAANGHTPLPLFIGVARGTLEAIASKNPRLAEHQKTNAGRPYSICNFRAYA